MQVLLKKCKLPTTCFLIGFILGGDLEDYFIQAVTAYGGKLTGFFVRPIGWDIWVLIIVSVVYALHDNKKDKKKAAAK